LTKNLPSDRERSSWLRAVWPILALWSFAIAAPLYDLLSQNPTYLLAHALTGWSLILFVLVMSLLLPLGILFSLFLPAFLHRSLHGLGRLSIALMGIGLVMAVFYGLLRKVVPEIAAASEFAVVTIVSLILAWCYRRSVRLQEFLRLASIATLILPLVFLWQLPRSYLLDNQKTSVHELAITGATPDIVLVVFDELALTTMLDEHQAIDAQRLPNFAALTAEATWYSHASAVAAGTRLAVPAIFTGITPDPNKAPDAASHPRNIFSMLQGAYAFNVEEPITRLCLLPECRRQGAFELVVLDTAVVLGHLAAPRWVVNQLPPIGGHWIGFWTPGGSDSTAAAGALPFDERIASIGRFVDGFASTASPGLHVLHSLLPHVPYTILPSGARLFRHAENPGHLLDSQGDRFLDTPWAITESRYQYEWQLQYVDRALGRIVKELKALDKYDNTLLIVTADHGLRFVPGKSRREPDAESFIDIAAIPMLIKSPMQSTGREVASGFQSTDIVPLIEGLLAADTEVMVSTERAILTSSGGVTLPERFDFTTQRNLLGATVARNNHRAFRLPAGPIADCGDRPSVTLAIEKVYQNTVSKHFLAAHLLFDISPSPDVTTVMAIVNNEAAGIHQTGEGQYSAFVDPQWLQDGYNSVLLVQVQKSGVCALYRLPK